jgi:hypothetical protein
MKYHISTKEKKKKSDANCELETMPKDPSNSPIKKQI